MKSNIKKIWYAALASILTCSATTADADVYRYVTKDYDGDAIFLDETTVVKSGEDVAYWVLNIESTYLRGTPSKSAYYLTRQSINCAAQTMRSTDMSIYDSAGERLASDSLGGEVGSIEPGTIEQQFYTILCTSSDQLKPARSEASTPLEAVRTFRDSYLQMLNPKR